MNSFELNKIMGAVLGTLLFVMGVGFIAEALYHPVEGRGPGYALPEPVVAEAGAEAAPAEPEVPLGILLASASVERGTAAARKCQSCHNFGEGEPNKQGPHLYDVVERAEGSVPDFAYSDAMLAHNAAGDIWTYENLNHFLASPRDYAPGTKMNFAGIRTAEERADILAYLQSLSASPKPFPPAEEAPAPEGEAAPAEGEAAPADAAAPAEGEAAPAPTDDATPAEPAATDATTTPEPAVENDEPATPAPATDTPTTTQTETEVEGTPTTSAPASEPATPAAPATTP